MLVCVRVGVRALYVRTVVRTWCVANATTLLPLLLQETFYMVSTSFARPQQESCWAVRSMMGVLARKGCHKGRQCRPAVVCVRVVVAWVAVFLQAVAIERLWALYVRTVVRTWYVANATTLLPLLSREIFT